MVEPPTSDRWPDWPTLSVVALVMSAATYGVSLTIADPDLWGHVRFGLDILQTGRIVHADPYSYLSGEQPWINHEWLAEVIFARTFCGRRRQGADRAQDRPRPLRARTRVPAPDAARPDAPARRDAR